LPKKTKSEKQPKPITPKPRNVRNLPVNERLVCALVEGHRYLLGRKDLAEA